MPKDRSDRVEIPNADDAGTDNGDTLSVAGESGTDGGTDGNGDNGGDTRGSVNGDGGSSGSDALLRGFADTGSVNGDDRIIRDEHGNPTYSPTGRIRKRRTRNASATGEPSKGPKTDKVSVKELQENIETNASLIFGAHLVIANVGRIPEMELNVEEATILSTPITPILMRNNIQPPQWVKDINGIIMAFGYVYGPRIKMIGDRLKEEKAAKAEAVRKSREQQVVPTGMGVFDISGNIMPSPLDMIRQ